MANPDTTQVSSNMGGIMTLGFFIGIIVIILFNYQDRSFFNGILYALIPILTYILMSIVIYISKTGTPMGKAFVGGLPTIGTTYLALLLCYISYVRLPVASVIAPLFLGSDANIISKPAENTKNGAENTKKGSENAKNSSENTKKGAENTKKGGSRRQKGGSCCDPEYSLEGIEAQFPTIKGISYAFYLFFSICFGGVVGLSSLTN
jgi:hypothetical protein